MPDQNATSPIDTQSASRRLATIPFIRALGMRALPIAAPEALTCIPSVPSITIPSVGGVCEGALAAAIDQAGSAAIWIGQGLQFPHATVTLSATFLDAPCAGDISFQARVASLTHGLGCTVVDARGADGGPVAHAMINYAMGVYPGGAEDSVTAPVADPARLNGEVISPLTGEDIETALGLAPDADGELRLPFAVNLVGSRDPVALHGGVIAASMVCAARRLASGDRRFRLSHLVVDYLRSGLPVQTSFRTTLVHRSRKTFTVRVDALQEGGDRHVATATARFFAAD